MCFKKENIKNSNVSYSLKKMLQDKKAIHKYFQNGKNKEYLYSKRIKFAIPI